MKSVDDVLRADLSYMAKRLPQELGMLSGRRLAVLGAGGFLGYYLVQLAVHYNRSLGATPIAITAVDRFSRGVPPWISALAEADELRVVKADVIEPLPPAFGDQDYIIHGAAIATPSFVRQNPIQAMEVNVTGLRHLLEYVRARKELKSDCRLLFMSSCEVYGNADPAALPTPETYPGRVSFTGPRAAYAEAKRFAETMCVNYAGQFGVQVVTVRPFDTYGPGLGLRHRRAVPDFARCILDGRDIEMLSDGSPTRTFCYVADAVCGYYQALVRGEAGQAYNIGAAGPEVSIRELAQTMTEVGREHLGYGGGVTCKRSDDPAFLVDNPDRRCPDISKARQMLGFDPQVGLREGLHRSLLWYQANR